MWVIASGSRRLPHPDVSHPAERRKRLTLNRTHMPSDKPEQPSCPHMTTSSGRPVGDNQNSITAGPRGPVLMEDYLLFEKMAQFNRERIPERVVHAKGAGAHGTFTVTGDITKYTTAKLFSETGKQTNTSVFLPIRLKSLALVYSMMSPVTVNVPCAPAPLAWTTRSGMRSRLNWAIFSKRR